MPTIRIVDRERRGPPEDSFPKISWRELLVFSSILAGFFFFAYRGYFGLGVLNQGDLSPLFPTWRAYLNAFYSSWSNGNLGTAGSATEAGFFNAAMLLLLQDNSLLAQKIVFLSTMPAACLAMFVFLSYRLALGFEKFIISFVYGVNPITIGLFFGGGVGLLTYYCVFPFLLLLMLNFLESQRIFLRSAVGFAVVLAFATAFDVQASIFVLPFVIAFSVSSMLAARSTRGALKIVASVVVAFAFFSILTLPSTFSYFNVVTGYFFGPQKGSIVNYSAGPRSHEALLSQVHDDFVFQTFDFLTYAISLTVIMGVIGFSIINRRRLRYVLTLLSLLTIGIAFWQLGIENANTWLYDAIPFLFALSTLKLKMLFVQTFVFLAAFLLEEARLKGIFGSDHVSVL